jgi:hypothetical protein
MVAVKMDGNYIDAEPMKSHERTSLMNAYHKIWDRWQATSTLAPNWHILDNEAPKELKQAIQQHGCPLELTPPDIHWQNTAKCGSQTFKGHFISILAGLPDDFPIHQWVKHIPQTILTLNLLRHAMLPPSTPWLCSTISHQTQQMEITGRTLL